MEITCMRRLTWVSSTDAFICLRIPTFICSYSYILFIQLMVSSLGLSPRPDSNVDLSTKNTKEQENEGKEEQRKERNM
jgi:hypothetical protein